MNAWTVLLLSFCVGAGLFIIKALLSKASKIQDDLRIRNFTDRVIKWQESCVNSNKEEDIPWAIPVTEASVGEKIVQDQIVLDKNHYYRFNVLLPKKTAPDLSFDNLSKLRKPEYNEKPVNESFFRPSEGATIIRLLPSRYPSHYLYNGSVVQCIGRKQHYLYNGSVVQCNKQLTSDNIWVGECPICDHCKHLWARGDIACKKGNHKESEMLRKEANKYKGRERYYYNVVVKMWGGISGQQNKNDTWQGPLIWSAPKSVHEQIQLMMNASQSDDMKLFDLQEGRSIEIHKKISGGCWPSYEVIPLRHSTPAGTPEQIEQWLANLWDLEKITAGWTKTPDEMKKEMVVLVQSHYILDSGAKDLQCEKDAIKTCKECQKQLQSKEESVIYCSKSCKKNSLSQRAKISCPLCGDQTIVYESTGATYGCGYSSGTQTVRTKCKYQLFCTCPPSKKDDYYGCECGAKDLQCCSTSNESIESLIHAEKKCKTCLSFLQSKEKSVIYCSKFCKQVALSKTKDGCPACGETETIILNGKCAYACEYSVDLYSVQTKCKYQPDCTCSDSKLRERDPCGCKCGAKDLQRRIF